MSVNRRKTVYFSGNVQGVGFRYTTQRIAQRFEVTGFVKNLPDGRVQLVAEGTLHELGRFGAEIESAMDGYFRSVESDIQPASGEFARFEIRF